MRLRFEHIIFLLVIVVVGCEKVIDVSLDTAETQVVIEAKIEDKMGDNYVALTKSLPVYGGNDFPTISGASVIVTDETGGEYIFEEVDGFPGLYTCPELKAEPSNHYYLTVEVDGKQYTSESITFEEPKIDSITTIKNDFGVAEILGFVPHQVYYHATDNPDEVNYYQANIWINDTLSEILYFGNDELINGQSYEAPFLGDPAQDGDSIRVSLHACDKGYYKYLWSFSNQESGTPFSAAPSNPVSNIKGENVVGYFAALTSDTLEIALPE